MAHAVPSSASNTQQSARVRALWATFERGLPPAQRTMQHKTLAAHADADRAYAALPPNSRPSPAQYAETKDARAREVARAHYDRMVADWHARLAGAGLTAEMWTDITQEEMERVSRALGADERTVHRTATQIKAPSLNTTARGANASSASWHSAASSASGASYALVKPSELNSEDEDSYFSPHTPFSASSASHSHSEPASPALSFHSAHASASENDADDDDDDDAPGVGRRDPFAPWAEPTTDSSNPSWNTHSRRTTLTGPYPYPSSPGSTSASAAASVASLAVPSAHSPHNTHPEYLAQIQHNYHHSNGHGQRTASSSSASPAHLHPHEGHHHSASHSPSPSQPPARIPQPYIGPSLLTTDDDESDPSLTHNTNGYSGTLDAEATAELDRFKLATRMRMIVEFHVAAAAAEIKLAGRIWRIRRRLPVSAPKSGEGEINERKTFTGSKQGKVRGGVRDVDDPTPRKPIVASKGKAKQTRKRNGLFGGDEDDNHSGHSSDDANSADEKDEQPTTPAALVLAHQSAMSALQAAKEAERCTIVKEECDRRRADKISGAKEAEKDTNANASKTGAGKDAKAVKGKDDRRKGRSGTLISGQPASTASKDTTTVPSAAAGVANAHQGGGEEEPWLSAAWRATQGDDATREGAPNGDDDNGAIAQALGTRFDSRTLLDGGGVEAFLDGVLPAGSTKYKATEAKDWGLQSTQPSPWGAQHTPTAATFGSHPHPPPHRRRASTSASASAAAAALTASAVPLHTSTNGSAHAPRLNRVHAPIPVRAAPFGDAAASASSSDEESSGLGSHWGSSTAAQNRGAGRGHTQEHAAGQRTEQRHVQSYDYGQSHHAPVPPGPPLQALERELDPEVMAAFVQYSGLGSAGGAGAVPLGGANVSSGSSRSNMSSGSSGSYGYGYSNGNSVFGGSSNNSSSMFSVPSNNHSHSGGVGNNNHYAAAAAAFGGTDYEAGRGRGGASAYASAAEALQHAVGGAVPGLHARGLPMAPVNNEPVQGWNAMQGRESSAVTNGHGSAVRSRSRSPTMRHGFPSWATRVTGSSYAQSPAEQQQQQQTHQFPPQMQVKDHPARGPTATPIASGWTRKFQKAPASTGTPQPQAASGTAMFALKNAFGFVDDAEPVAPTSAPAPVASSWLGSKGKKAAGATLQGSPLPTHETEVSLWEQVTQQKAKAGLVMPVAAGSGSGKKEVSADPSPLFPQPIPTKAEKAFEKEKAVDSTLSALGGKKQMKKQRQVPVKMNGKVETPEPEPEAGPEPVFPTQASANGKGMFVPPAAVDDEDDENGRDSNNKGMFSMPSKMRGGPPVTTIGRQRLNSISNSGGWDAEAGTASTPRPATKIPAHLQSLAAAMSTPPPLGLKPLMNGASQVQQPTERPGTGLGMNSSTIRARGASAAPAWGSTANSANSASAQSGSGSTGRSLWGIFGGGTSDTASKSQVDGWGVTHNEANEEEVDVELGDDGIGGGDDDWTPISRGSAQPEKAQAQAQPTPASLAQRLGRRVSEAVAPQPTPEPTITAAAATSKKVNGKKGAKGKKVMIEDVPDDETDNRGETLPVDSRHVFDDAEPSVILEPKPSVPPGTYNSIISYTDEENERKSSQAGAATATAPDNGWMEAAAKELKETAAKKAAATGNGGGGGGVWGTNASKTASGASVVAAPEEVKAPQETPNVVAKGGKQPAGQASKGKKKTKGR